MLDETLVVDSDDIDMPRLRRSIAKLRRWGGAVGRGVLSCDLAEAMSDMD
jgi:hypothetical protein